MWSKYGFVVFQWDVEGGLAWDGGLLGCCLWCWAWVLLGCVLDGTLGHCVGWMRCGMWYSDVEGGLWGVDGGWCRFVVWNDGMDLECGLSGMGWWLALVLRVVAGMGIDGGVVYWMGHWGIVWGVDEMWNVDCGVWVYDIVRWKLTAGCGGRLVQVCGMEMGFGMVGMVVVGFCVLDGALGHCVDEMECTTNLHQHPSTPDSPPSTSHISSTSHTMPRCPMQYTTPCCMWWWAWAWVLSGLYTYWMGYWGIVSGVDEMWNVEYIWVCGIPMGCGRWAWDGGLLVCCLWCWAWVLLGCVLEGTMGHCVGCG